jgi:quercetin dioxygenase-like cupin family protein
VRHTLRGLDVVHASPALRELVRIRRIRPGLQRSCVLAGAVVAALTLVIGLPGVAPTAGQVEERGLVDNERVRVVEFVFPPGFRGEEHVAPVDEFAYVVEGEFAVVTKGKGKQVVRRGEVEWAPKGVVHYSVNETKKPARVLVVLLKER